MDTPNVTPDDKSPDKKGGWCETKCCGKGSCELKLQPLCFLIKITFLVGLVVLVVQYFMN